VGSRALPPPLCPICIRHWQNSRLVTATYRQKSTGVFFRTRCTTVFGLCAVNVKRHIAQEYRLKLSEFKGNYSWIWSTWQHVNSLGDASLNNDSFIHCVNINNGANLQLPLDVQKQTGIQLQGGGFVPLTTIGGSAPWILAGGSAPDPRYRLALCARHWIRTLWSSKLSLILANQGGMDFFWNLALIHTPHPYPTHTTGSFVTAGHCDGSGKTHRSKC